MNVCLIHLLRTHFLFLNFILLFSIWENILKVTGYIFLLNDFYWSIVILQCCIGMSYKVFLCAQYYGSLKYFIKYHPHFIGDETKAQKSKRTLL